MSSLHNWDQREEQQMCGWTAGSGYRELLEADYGHAQSKHYLCCQHEHLRSLLKNSNRAHARQ
jgi:hypothetical protein